MAVIEFIKRCYSRDADERVLTRGRGINPTFASGHRGVLPFDV